MEGTFRELREAGADLFHRRFEPVRAPIRFAAYRGLRDAVQWSLERAWSWRSEAAARRIRTRSSAPSSVKDGEVIQPSQAAPTARLVTRAPEVNAIAAGEEARGATMYVTMEPCTHHGDTPRCVDAVLNRPHAHVHHQLAAIRPRSTAEGSSGLPPQALKPSLSTPSQRGGRTRPGGPSRGAGAGGAVRPAQGRRTCDRRPPEAQARPGSPCSARFVGHGVLPRPGRRRQRRDALGPPRGGLRHDQPAAREHRLPARRRAAADVVATHDTEKALDGADVVVFAVPSQTFRPNLEQWAP